MREAENDSRLTRNAGDCQTMQEAYVNVDTVGVPFEGVPLFLLTATRAK